MKLLPTFEGPKTTDSVVRSSQSFHKVARGEAGLRLRRLHHRRAELRNPSFERVTGGAGLLTPALGLGTLGRTRAAFLEIAFAEPGWFIALVVVLVVEHER